MRTFEAADGKVSELTVKIHMKPGEAISDVEMQIMESHAYQGMDRYYNFDKAGGRLHALPDGSKLHVRLEMVDNPAEADLVVSVENSFDPTNGKRLKTNQTTWRTHDAGDDMAAHEVSHQLGLLDEYVDLRRSPRRKTFEDNSLVGDFLTEGSQTASIKQRHLDQFGRDVEQGRARGAMRPTQEMPAVQAPPIDEAKAAAETRKLPQQVPIDEEKAAAETQRLPAQTGDAAATKVAPEMPRWESVELTEDHAPIGEIDGVEIDEHVDGDRFIEKKRATGFDNPKNTQSPEQWAEKQLVDKTTNRIAALERPNVASRVGSEAPAGLTSVPGIDELRAIKKFVFQIESTSPDVKAAATKACEKLTSLHGSKGYTFTVEYGVK